MNDYVLTCGCGSHDVDVECMYSKCLAYGFEGEIGYAASYLGFCDYNMYAIVVLGDFS